MQGEQDKGGPLNPGRVLHLVKVKRQHGRQRYDKFICEVGGIGFGFRGAVLAEKFPQQYFGEIRYYKRGTRQ